MRKVIHSLRRQPEQVKRQVLYIATLVCGLILAFLWVYSLGSRVDNVSVESIQQPVSNLKSSVIDGYNNLSDFNLE